MTISLAREIADLTTRLDQIAPADVETLSPADLRTLARQTRARADAIDALANRRGGPTPEPIAYAVVWEATDGEKVIDKPPTTLDIARAELADYRDRWPEMKHYLVALVPVVTP